jgi:uncharacterized protein
MHLSLFGNRLEIGLDGPLSVRHEILRASDACRLCYFSDIHLRRGRSEHLIRHLIAAVQRQVVDAILLGGDLLDQRSEREPLRELVAALSRRAPVFAIGGNHDRWVGMDLVARAVREGGGHWIHDTHAEINHKGRLIVLSGPDAGAPPPASVRIKCAHYPSAWRKARQQGFDLVLAGHLHGCQIVAFEVRDCLFPGAFFYPHCALRRRSHASHLIVSRGVSDLIPIRWCCPREVVLCDV